MRRRSDSPISDFFTFRLMLTPVLIQLVFWSGTLGCVLAGLRVVASSFDAPGDRADVRDAGRFELEPVRPADKARAKWADTRPFSPATFAAGVAILIVGPLLLRLYCELLIVIFKIHDELKAANDRSRYHP